MRDQYKVLAEKYTSLIEESSSEQFKKVDELKLNIPDYISRLKKTDSIGEFYDIAGEINSDFNTIAELFYSPAKPGEAQILSNIVAKHAYEAAWDYRTELLYRELPKQVGSVPPRGSREYATKPSREDSGPLSFYKALVTALQLQAIDHLRDGNRWKEMNKEFMIAFGNWTYYKKASEKLQKGSEEAGVNLDI